MELWIRSQDKRHLLKVDNINWFGGEIYTNDSVCLETTKDRETYLLGEYNNGKRALEVLDEIQKVIEDGVFKERYEEGNDCYIGTKIPIYEMPKE